MRLIEREMFALFFSPEGNYRAMDHSDWRSRTRIWHSEVSEMLLVSICLHERSDILSFYGVSFGGILYLFWFPEGQNAPRIPLSKYFRATL